MKNKQEMEQLLSTHGGTYKADFGLNETMDFGDGKNGIGWNRLVDYVQGRLQDNRVEQTISSRREDRKHPEELKKNNNPVTKVSRRPESITDVTRAFLTNVQQTKGKKKKIRAININKKLKKNNLKQFNR
jgi:hypothetical protein